MATQMVFRSSIPATLKELEKMTKAARKADMGDEAVVSYDWLGSALVVRQPIKGES